MVIFENSILSTNLHRVHKLCILQGSSDPYAKFILNGANVYKSKIIFKNLNPQWNEEFTIKLSPSVLGAGGFSQIGSKLATLNESSSVISNAGSMSTHAQQLEFFLSKFKLKIYVYDYDRGFLADDLIGYATIDLSSLRENM